MRPDRIPVVIATGLLLPDCPPGTMCPLWVTDAGLKITIT
jgi:hypothetical protein